MSEAKLLPCPFCGGAASQPKVEQIEHLGWVGRIECDDCNAVLSTLYSENSPGKAGTEVVATWNQRPTCEWRKDPDEDHMPDTYDSACGEKWSFIDGGPAENSVRFCQGCGKTVRLAGAQPSVKGDQDA